MKTNKLLELRTSGSGCGDIRMVFDGITLTVEYEFCSKIGNEVASVRFDGVIAHCFRDEMHSYGFPDSSYDAIVEVDSSDWIKQLASDEPKNVRSVNEAKHFVVMLSNNGFLEIVATSFEDVGVKNGERLD